VSPLRADVKRFVDKARNPLFQDPGSDLAFWTAHRDGRVVGRITAHVHAASNRIHGLNRGYFGYFDCADDAEAAAALLGAAQDWCRARALSEISGNFNLTAMQQIGVVTGDFDQAPYLDQVWSPPHIARLLAENGFAPGFPMTTFALDLITTEPPGIGPKQRAVLDDPDYSFAPITRRTIPKRMEEARAILNASFVDNPMFVPVTEAEFHFQAKDMKWVLDQRISAVLHHRGEPVCCVICVPDMNPFLRAIRSRIGWMVPFRFLSFRRTNRRAVLIFAGVRPDMQGQGVNPLVLRRVIMGLKEAGYHTLGNTWIADVNKASLTQTVKAGAKPMHRLHLFSKAL
jgi:GNAT superfamily N-acetyltransferase